MSESTLYQRIGGEIAIHAAVDRFYERVLADPSLNHFFINVNMARLKGHQFAFLSQALGGPKQYSRTYMEVAHAKLAVERYHFDLVATHLVPNTTGVGCLGGSHRRCCWSGSAAGKPDCEYACTCCNFIRPACQGLRRKRPSSSSSKSTQ
jgi:hemoglobin